MKEALKAAFTLVAAIAVTAFTTLVALIVVRWAWHTAGWLLSLAGVM